ncbi:erythromycin esterase family protein [Nocardia sp. NBC_01329]|uniref:erythromycin esterase family protein n=1 Tax=Nocardia sp. NBC_01329 TaxID=2903594 RepID=UPI002E104D7F|nr:erythromycin esterase family protein [Nocardia sp. NBC_01329]
MTMIDTPRQWIEQHAHPLATFEPAAPLNDLAPLGDLARNANVVALGAATRDTHELSVLAHRMLRFLVEESGFRTVALEGDSAASSAINDYVVAGVGDPRALMANARTFWRTQELLDVVKWLRRYNMRHPHDPVRVAQASDAVPPSYDLGDIERFMAEEVIRWHERTGEKIVYWGGMAHTADGMSRTIPMSGQRIAHRNAGSYLRQRFGAGYISMGLMFDHGVGAQNYPTPPTDFIDSTLGDTALDAYLLNLAMISSARAQPWLTEPAKSRLVGPGYDPADDADQYLAGGSLAEWFDGVVHCRKVTGAHWLHQ